MGCDWLVVMAPIDIDLNLRPFFIETPNQMVERGEMTQLLRHIRITITPCPFSDATYA